MAWITIEPDWRNKKPGWKKWQIAHMGPETMGIYSPDASQMNLASTGIRSWSLSSRRDRRESQFRALRLISVGSPHASFSITLFWSGGESSNVFAK